MSRKSRPRRASKTPTMPERKRTKVRITSDGTPSGTVVHTEDGVELDGIVSVSWRVDARGLARAVVEFINVEAELAAAVSTDEVDAYVELLGRTVNTLAEAARKCRTLTRHGDGERWHRADRIDALLREALGDTAVGRGIGSRS